MENSTFTFKVFCLEKSFWCKGLFICRVIQLRGWEGGHPFYHTAIVGKGGGETTKRIYHSITEGGPGNTKPGDIWLAPNNQQTLLNQTVPSLLSEWPTHDVIWPIYLQQMVTTDQQITFKSCDKQATKATNLFLCFTMRQGRSKTPGCQITTKMLKTKHSQGQIWLHRVVCHKCGLF